jgi:hypothetical protein
MGGLWHIGSDACCYAEHPPYVRQKRVKRKVFKYDFALSFNIFFNFKTTSHPVTEITDRKFTQKYVLKQSI